jgi:ketosteroid isomerase-like protein
MGSANLQLVRSLYAAWQRGDFSSVEWAHPEIEYVVADGIAPSDWRGLSGMADGFREFLSAWDDFRLEVEQYRELDDGRVLVFIHHIGRGKTSGLELAQVPGKRAHLFDIRDGKVTRLVVYYDRERALADLGLATETR